MLMSCKRLLQNTNCAELFFSKSAQIEQRIRSRQWRFNNLMRRRAVERTVKSQEKRTRVLLAGSYILHIPESRAAKRNSESPKTGHFYHTAQGLGLVWNTVRLRAFITPTDMKRVSFAGFPHILSRGSDFLACILPPPPPPPPRPPTTSRTQNHTLNITHPTSHPQHHTPNITHPTSHTQHHTLNVTHSTSHTQHHTLNVAQTT